MTASLPVRPLDPHNGNIEHGDEASHITDGEDEDDCPEATELMANQMEVKWRSQKMIKCLMAFVDTNGKVVLFCLNQNRRPMKHLSKPVTNG